MADEEEELALDGPLGDEEDGDEGVLYQLIPASECAVCSAVAGVYDTLPVRPHLNCQCSIEFWLGRLDPPVDCSTYWAFEQIKNVYTGDRDDPEGDYTIDIIVHVYVECPNGDVWMEECTIPYDRDLEDPMTAFEADVYDHALEMAEEHCRLVKCPGVS